MNVRPMTMTVLDFLASHDWDGDAQPGNAAVGEARDAMAAAIEALKLAERTIAGTLHARGYLPGSCTDGWSQEVRDEVAALVPIRAALARLGVST